MIDTYEQCTEAARIISNSWYEHPIKFRKLGNPVVSGVWYTSPLNIPEDDPTHKVWIPTHGRHMPPKCAPLISELLADAGLETIPVVYFKVGAITHFPG